MDLQERAARQAILRINGRAWGIATGLLLALSIFLATNILVLRGGEDVGAHLRLLGIFFPGYTVTFGGSFVGFIYGFVVGYGLGRLIGTIYNYSAGLKP
jgi:hypothetical protein